MGKIIEINGPIVRVEIDNIHNGEQVKVGHLELMGEVISLEGRQAIVQVYEATDTLKPGGKVEALGHPLSVELGPGLLGQIFDGVQRPLPQILARSGDYIGRGLNLDPLDREKTWPFVPTTTYKPGDKISAGQILGSVQETETINQQIMLPPDLCGILLSLSPAGSYSIEQTIATIQDSQDKIHKIQLFQRWPVRMPRPYQKRTHASEPLFTGQRILDTFFPLLKGGKAAVPGPFGAGKTMVQQQIARWADADIVLYVGCGERGNELVDILESFPKLMDPYTGRSLMERTLLVANTSNMPVVAREASIYIGITIAEFFRDQGFDVVMVADSTSRWAEALREVSGRLGQMPVEEGYPAYLASNLAAFYERAGQVEALNGKTGSVTIIGAVSPPGGDFSEPVTSHTKEIIQTFWALSKELADARHYPAVDWNESFSDYVKQSQLWWGEHIDSRWAAYRAQAMSLLTQADELTRIVNLVGQEALSAPQRWVLEGAKLIKEGLLQQSALDEIDSFCSQEKQFLLLEIMLDIYQQGQELLALDVPAQQLADLPLLAQAKRLKSRYRNDQPEAMKAFKQEVEILFDRIRYEYKQVHSSI